MKLLIVGDVHNRWEKLEKIVDKFSDHKIIQVGDQFDDFGDNQVIARETAQAVKRLLERPNYVQLFGNHDLPYCPRFKKLDCAGFTFEKYDAINDILTEEDWNKFKFYHHEYGWYFSHAGFTRQWFTKPLSGELTRENIDRVLEESIEEYKANIFPLAIYGADYYRGGNLQIGGLLWCDWRALPNIPSVKQVVGHTPMKSIFFKEDISIQSININVDCNLKEVLEINENGSYSIIKI